MAKDPSKTEKATSKRVNKARKDGSVAKGEEMGKIMTLIAGVIGLRVIIETYYDQFYEIFHWFFTKGIFTKLDKNSVYLLFIWCSEKLALLLLPLFLFIAFIAYLILRLQVGKLWTTKVFKPKFSKIFNIFAGLKRLMFDIKIFIRLGKSVLLASVVAIAPYIVIQQEKENFIPLFYSNAHQLAIYILQVGYKMVTYAMVPMIVIAIADLWYARWNYQDELKMSKDEVKDERKAAEGDPQVKQQQQQKRIAMMQQRMMADVPKADVVITNPTHYAIALRYDAMLAPAPQVLAKGTNKVAERIKAVARENNIPIRENKPLAQALYKQVEIGDIIPEELYQAVAAILAKLNNFTRR
ncbi:flagellar type III secretion system protein FlhB [Maridesulfovibrio hydrothermalis]|uniref:Type III secretion exporter n=1 Tax=Maridesulfovibrio hydrothermalis AM13 = DSM 14728 TaxID=1121451 RepID=L0RDY4_9BACT|nr:flagellar type III secretion system protein FlhB [Maridesulfovibrio hydrothermalis]CCO24954.1 Type III secretion exporter [Maridesulfovibrio hydrothermalis AM13 = DSM 14728]